MLLCEILKVKQPEEFVLLCTLFGIDDKDLQKSSNEVDWFNPAWEMTHDSEGQYLNYSSRGHKVG